MTPDIKVGKESIHLSKEEAVLVSAALVHERVNRLIEAKNEARNEKTVEEQTKFLMTLAKTVRKAADQN